MELWAHQKRAIEVARTKEHLALFYEIGTGKTATMINILREEYSRRRIVAPTLILCPLTICAQWKTEFAKFSRIPQEKILVLTGAGKKRTESMNHQLTLGRDFVVITNYEAMQIKDFYATLLKWSPEILVLDESHLIKDSTSVRAKKIYPLAHAAHRRFIMTGTPVLNSLLDLFGQYKAMDPDIFGGNFFTFRQKFFYDKNAYMPKHVHFPNWQARPEASSKIGAIIANSSLVAKRADCLDLPELQRIIVPTEMAGKQAKAYAQMERDFVAEVGNQVIAAEFAMTKTLRLQQILSGFLSEDSEAEAAWLDSVPKLDIIHDLLVSIGGQKTIIWTVFRPTYDKLAKVCEKAGYKVAFLTGDQSTTEKQASIEAFRHGDVNALIANPSAGGVGVNLFEAPVAIYYAKGYSLAHYEQSEGRNYRAGSEMHEKVIHYHLVTPGTIDEVISEALIHKRQVGQEVLKWAANKSVAHSKK